MIKLFLLKGTNSKDRQLLWNCRSITDAQNYLTGLTRSNTTIVVC